MSTNDKDSKGTTPTKVAFTGSDFLAEIIDYTSDTDRTPDCEALGSRPIAILTQRVADNIGAVVQSAVGIPLGEMSPNVREVVLGAVGEPTDDLIRARAEVARLRQQVASLRLSRCTE